MPHLPIELSDHIIDNLHDEPKSLASCALVCRAWVFVSQRGLFSTLYVDEKNIEPILESPPRFVGHVQHIYVHVYGDRRASIKLRLSKEDRSPLLDRLLPHLSLFTSVKELSLDGCRQFVDLKWNVEWTDIIAASFPSLPKLNILYFNFEALAHLVDLVASSSDLTHLVVDDIDVEEASHEYSNEDQEPYEGSQTPPPALESIRYSSGDRASGGGPFLRWFATNPGTFKTLHLILDAEAGDINAGVALIAAAGDGLRNLTLSFDDQWHLWEGFELSANTNLRNLVFRRPSDLKELEESLWPGLVAALMSIPSLKKVRFYAGYGKTAQDWAKDFAEEHPQFVERGIVVFDNKQHHEW
ncbi:hypothetical protein C8F01DRAFT_1242565 [Mycena amicta]|nr:hypothetical protein C8F01DRAFT_1242565 [Mycena amicta]